MTQLVGHCAEGGWTVPKQLLLFDLVVTVAIGAIIGRIAT